MSPQPTMTLTTPLVTTTTPRRTAMIILNTPIPGSPLFHYLWNLSSYRICADGGANWIRKLNLVPDLITGDLDSLTDATRQHYTLHHNVPIHRIHDQDRNDLDKAISFLDPPDQYDQIVVYGALAGGRFDQQMANLQALYVYNNGNNNTNKCYPPLFLYCDTSMACLIPPCCSQQEPCRLVLRLPATGDNNDTDSMIAEGPTCGLIPLGEPVQSITTTGLQWNLHQDATHFGGLVSTSNRIAVLDNDNDNSASCVTIATSHPIVFTAEVHCGLAVSSSDWTTTTEEDE